MFNIIARLSSSKSLHVYKQAYATFTSCLLSVSGGITFGFTAVLLPQLENDSNFPDDISSASWIASISPLAMIVGCMCVGPMNDVLGRKISHIMLIFPFLIGWIIMGFATNNTLILIGRFITGMCTGAVRSINMVYVGEITDPKYRATYLFCPTLALYIGSLISHIVGTYLYWRTSCFIFGLPNIVCFILILFVDESPLWLISKGKIVQGTKVFKQFRGEEEAAEKELAAVLQNQSEKEPEFKHSLNIIYRRAFLKSLITVFLLFLAVQSSGINTISFYAQDIFQRTFSGDVDPFILMLVTDCIRVMAATTLCVFGKILPRKITFLVCCFTTVFFLISLAVYLCIQPVGLVWIAVTCMVSYIGIASALTSFSWSFVAEIFPSNVRGVGSGLSSCLSYLLLFLSVKITPGVIATFGGTVMYAGFAIVTLVAAVLLCFMLPETNGRSLQDIEDTLYKQNDNKKSMNMKTVSQTGPV